MSFAIKLSFDFAVKVTVVRAVQSPKQELSCVTESGIAIDTRAVQSSKAPTCIAVRVFGRVTLVSEVQPLKAF